MPPPTLTALVRQTLGRALRESGQALDRAGTWMAIQAESRRDVGDPPPPYLDHLSRHRTLYPLVGHGTPRIDPGVALVAPCAVLAGTVRVGRNSSVWYGAVLRGDRSGNGMGRSDDDEEGWRRKVEEEGVLEGGGTATTAPTAGAALGRGSGDARDPALAGGGVYVGEGSNVQDGAVVTATEGHAVLGDHVTVGHGAHVHSSTVGEGSLVGMNAVLRPGSSVGVGAMVAAGAVVGRNVHVPGGELWAGSPARRLRDLTGAEVEGMRRQAEMYVAQARGQGAVMELGGNVPDADFELDLGKEPDPEPVLEAGSEPRQDGARQPTKAA